MEGEEPILHVRHDSDDHGWQFHGSEARAEDAKMMSQEDCARKWLPGQVYRDEAHAASAVDWLIRQFDLQMTPKTNAFVFGVEDKATARLIGHVGLSPLFDGVEVGFGIATSEQGKGYAAEAVSRACAWGFERFSLLVILGVTDAENVASQRVLRR